MKWILGKKNHVLLNDRLLIKTDTVLYIRLGRFDDVIGIRQWRTSILASGSNSDLGHTQRRITERFRIHLSVQPYSLHFWCNFWKIMVIKVQHFRSITYWSNSLFADLASWEAWRHISDSQNVSHSSATSLVGIMRLPAYVDGQMRQALVVPFQDGEIGDSHISSLFHLWDRTVYTDYSQTLS